MCIRDSNTSVRDGRKHETKSVQASFSTVTYKFVDVGLLYLVQQSRDIMGEIGIRSATLANFVIEKLTSK